MYFPTLIQKGKRDTAKYSRPTICLISNVFMVGPTIEDNYRKDEGRG